LGCEYDDLTEQDCLLNGYGKQSQLLQEYTPKPPACYSQNAQVQERIFMSLFTVGKEMSIEDDIFHLVIFSENKISLNAGEGQDAKVSR
jgi:hypothetical protein